MELFANDTKNNYSLQKQKQIENLIVHFDESGLNGPFHDTLACLFITSGGPHLVD